MVERVLFAEEALGVFVARRAAVQQRLVELAQVAAGTKRLLSRSIEQHFQLEAGGCELLQNPAMEFLCNAQTLGPARIVHSIR